MHALVGLAALLLALVGPQAEEMKKPTGPGVAEMSVFPRLVLWSPVQPTAILILVSIPKPTPEFYCPAVELFIYPEGQEISKDVAGLHKKYEADCPPWSSGGFHRDGEGNIVDDPDTTLPWTWRVNSAREHWGLGPGEWIVEVYLRQGKKGQMLRGNVSVRGGGD